MDNDHYKNPGVETMEMLCTEEAIRQLKNNQILHLCPEYPREAHPRRGMSQLHPEPSGQNRTLNNNLHHNRWHRRQCLDLFQVDHHHCYTNGNKPQKESSSDRRSDPKIISWVFGCILERKSSMIPWITMMGPQDQNEGHFHTKIIQDI